MARVLVVEDEPALLEALEYSLARQGHEVLAASDGERGLQLGLTGRPDLGGLEAWTASRYVGACDRAAACPSSCSPRWPTKSTKSSGSS